MEALVEQFKDITPVEQERTGICEIQYPEEYVTLMDYFRAIYQASERSPRVLPLTSEIIAINSANYTIWHYRRATFAALHPPAQGLEPYFEDLRWANKLGLAAPKNYQVWYHKRATVETILSHFGGDVLNVFREEADYVLEVLTGDAKNYHAWSYRQWLVERILGLVGLEARETLRAGEFALVEELVRIDLLNNSAWSHRTYLLRFFGCPDPAAELQWAMERAARRPNNSAVWYFVRGLAETNLWDGEGRAALEACVQEFVGKFPACHHALATLCDVQEHAYRLSGEQGDLERAIASAEKMMNHNGHLLKKWWAQHMQDLIDERKK